MRVLEVKGVPAGEKHYISRILAGSATARDVELWEDHVATDKKGKELSSRLAADTMKMWHKRNKEKMCDRRLVVIWAGAYQGDEAVFKELQRFPNAMRDLISIRDCKERTPLHVLCKYGHLPCLRLHLEMPLSSVANDPEALQAWRLKGGVPTPNIRSAKGYTPFHYAIVSGHLRCVEYMLAYFELLQTTEAEMDAVAEGRDAVEIARWFEWNGIRQLLESVAAPIHAKRERQRAQIAAEAEREKERQKREAAEREIKEKREMEAAARAEEAIRRLEDGKRNPRSKEDQQMLILMHEDHKRSIDDMKRKTEEHLQNLFARLREGQRRSSEASVAMQFSSQPESASCAFDEYDDSHPEDAEVCYVIERAKAPVADPRLGLCVSEGIRFGHLGKLPHNGLKVQSLDEGGPAAQVGIQEGDVITAVSGVAVAGFTDFSRALEAHGLTGLSLTVRSGGRERTVDVVPARGTAPSAHARTLRVKALGVLWRESDNIGTSHKRAPWVPPCIGHTTSPPLPFCSRALSPIRERPWHNEPPRPHGPTPVKPLKAVHDCAWK